VARLPTRRPKTMAPPFPLVSIGTARISARAKSYVAEVLESAWLSDGPFRPRLEALMAALHDVRHAIFCNSGTSALQCAFAALRELDGWHDGDEVIVPAVTFVATANMVLANGLHPVFVDVDARTYNLDAGRLADAIGPRTRAIVPAHLFGLPCDMDAILAIARGHGLRVVEDSCETMFVSYRNRPVGSFGDVACFSTRAGHLVTTGIGGFACTSDDRIACIMRSLVNDGRAEVADAAPLHKRFVFDRLGFSYRATELEAALAVAQMEEREAMLESRRRNAALLDRLLAPVGDELVRLPSRPPDREHAFAMYPLVLGAGAREKDAVLAHLGAHGIETRDLLPLLSQPTYRRLCGDDVQGRFPVAHWLDARGFYVGCHEGLGEREITHLATTLGQVVHPGVSVAPSAA